MPRAAPATTARGRSIESPAGPSGTGIERDHVPPLRSPAFIDGDSNHVMWRGRSSRLIRHRMLDGGASGVESPSASDATPAVSPSPRDLSPRQLSLPTASGVVSGKRRLVSERWAPRRTPTALSLCGMSTPSDAAAAFAEPSPLSLPQSPDHLIPDVHEQPSLPESPEFDASGHERQPRWQTPSAANAAAVALLGVDDFDGAVSTLSNNAAARRVTPTPNFEKLSRRLAASWAGYEFDSEDDDKADSTTARSTVPGRSILRRSRRNSGTGYG
jgi:hypothetical protein